MAYFDDVLIPWDRVFHVGDPDHAKFYPQRLFDWIHIETQIRHVVNAEMIAGLGVLITEALGTASAPIVASQLADLIRFRETCRAFMIAAEETGFDSPGGLYKANNVFVDFGRAFYLENVHRVIETLIDFCGRGVVVFPTKADLDHPELGPELRLALRGHNISAEDRTRIFRYIHERFLTDWGGRHAMFEKFNGTPLWVIKLLTMQRVEYQVDGPLTAARPRRGRSRRCLAARAAHGRGVGRLPVDSLQAGVRRASGRRKHTRPDAGRLAAGRKSRRRLAASRETGPPPTEHDSPQVASGQERSPFLAPAPCA